MSRWETAVLNLVYIHIPPGAFEVDDPSVPQNTKSRVVAFWVLSYNVTNPYIFIIFKIHLKK